MARLLVLQACLAVLLLPSVPAREKEKTTWTNQEGRAIQARIVSFEPGTGKVRLRLSNGRQAVLDLATLSAGDQAWVKDWQQRQEDAARSEPPPAFRDPQPQRHKFKARASELDPAAREHPEIDFVFAADGKPQDEQNASVDTSVEPQGRLVIWLMGYNDALFQRLNGYGLHAIQVHYANRWFAKLCQPSPKDGLARGKIRLEAAIGEDVSDEIDIPKPDSVMERSRQFLRWLAEEHETGRWDQFLTEDGAAVRWDKVTLAGASHGATTAARFAQHQAVDRVVMHCGPRDQDQDWQALPSATAAERYFGFTHVLDGGWTGKHYCRSWELLGLHRFGPVVTVDGAEPPFGNSRRLVSAADVGGDADKAHSAVTPGSASPKGADGAYLYEAVWEYLYNHPVREVGEPVERDPDCAAPAR
jgi:hypothetical protein